MAIRWAVIQLTEPPISHHLGHPDPFIEFAGTTVTEADAGHAVAEQPGNSELDNHAGVRHAGALFTVGYAASRALVAAALAERAQDTEVQTVNSDVVYDTVASGLVTATAEPGDGWDSALAGVSGGQDAELSTAVTLRDGQAKTVATMKVDWRVSIASPGGRR